MIEFFWVTIHVDMHMMFKCKSVCFFNSFDFNVYIVYDVFIFFLSSNGSCPLPEGVIHVISKRQAYKTIFDTFFSFLHKIRYIKISKYSRVIDC